MKMCFSMPMGAVQGRALIFTVLYTYRWYVPQPCQPLCCSQAHLFQCVQTELHRLSSPTGFFIAPKSEPRRITSACTSPNRGILLQLCKELGKRTDTFHNLKESPTSQTNEQTKEYVKSTNPPPPSPRAQKYLLLLNFPFWTLARK